MKFTINTLFFSFSFPLFQRLLDGLKAQFDDETHIKECEGHYDLGHDLDLEMTSKPPSYDMVVGNVA